MYIHTYMYTHTHTHTHTNTNTHTHRHTHTHIRIFPGANLLAYVSSHARILCHQWRRAIACLPPPLDYSYPWMQLGYTALMYAAINGKLQIAQELLKRGANVEAKVEVMAGDGVGVGVSNEGWVHVWSGVAQEIGLHTGLSAVVVCVCVCVWGGTNQTQSTHAHARTHTHTHESTHIHTYTKTHTYTRARTHIYAYTHIRIYTHTRKRTHTHTHTYAYTYTHTHTHGHTHTHIRTCTHARTHTWTYTHGHTHTYTFHGRYVPLTPAHPLPPNGDGDAPLHASHIHTYAYTHTHTHIRTYAHAHTHIHTHSHATHTHTYTFHRPTHLSTYPLHPRILRHQWHAPLRASLPPWIQGGESALMWAAGYGHLQIVQELLKHGANIEAKAMVMAGGRCRDRGRQ